MEQIQGFSRTSTPGQACETMARGIPGWLHGEAKGRVCVPSELTKGHNMDQFTKDRLHTWAYSYCADSGRAEVMIEKITSYLAAADTPDIEYALQVGWPRVYEMANAAETYSMLRNP